MAYIGATLLICILLVVSCDAVVSASQVCAVKVLNASAANFNLTHSKSVTNASCYQFSLYGFVDANVYLTFDKNLQDSNVTRITIFNVNAHGNLTVFSDRSFEGLNSPSDPYIAVGAGGHSGEVVRVIIYVDYPYLVNKSSVVGAASNKTCELTLKKGLRNITNPDYQMGLSQAISCTYNIDWSLSNDVSELTDSLVFEQFRIGTGGRLTIGTNTESYKYHGTDLPADYLIANKPFIVSMSINTKTNDVFSAFPSQSTKECTTELTVSSAGLTYKSPGYPGDYSNNLNCKILLRAQNDTERLLLKLIDIELARDADTVWVIDGGASRYIDKRLVAHLSAMDDYKSRDDAMISSDDTVLIKFVTDELGTSKGFQLNVSSTAASGLYFTNSDVSYAPKSQDSAQLGKLLFLAPESMQVKLVPDFPGGVEMLPAARFRCYDGPGTQYPLVASYRTDFTIATAAYSSSRKMLCVASDFRPNKDVFNATIEAVPEALNKFSSDTSGFYSLNVDVGEAGEDAVTRNWIILREDNSSSVVEITISEVTFPKNSSDVNITLYSMKQTLYANITNKTILPFRMRLPLATALRLQIDIAPRPNSSKSSFSISASYKLDNVIEKISNQSQSDSVMSPYYPQGTPAYTKKRWVFTVPANKSLQLAFSSQFELTNGSNLTVQNANTSIILSNTTGPTMTPPSDLIVNNTNYSQPIIVNIDLSTLAQSHVSGVKISYTQLDAGYSSNMTAQQTLQSPAYPTRLNKSYDAVWVISVPKNNSKGMLELLNVDVTFTPDNNTVLELRDGANVDSPILTDISSVSSLNLEKSTTITTSTNSLYVSYRFVKKSVNSTGSPFLIKVTPSVCKNELQCLTSDTKLTNLTVCMPVGWRCDGLYHCLDGKDELNCAPAPTTKQPAVTKQGAAWWVVALCVIAGVIIGIIATVIIITTIMRRRGRGYTRLSELMTPVPT